MRSIFSWSRTGRHYVLAAAVVLLPWRIQAQPVLDTTQFIVVGEGLAAGMADFALREVYQEKSFPAQMARQMKTAFPQPLIESPGIGSAPGFTALPPRLPGTHQGSVRLWYPPPYPTPPAGSKPAPSLFVFNLSVPGFRLADSLNRRPSSPLVQQRDTLQTVTNLILGYPAMILGRDKPLWTQAEYAVQMSPTLVIVELGYFDVLEPAVTDDPSKLPDVAAFRTNFTRLLAQLNRASPQMVVMTIPDPFDTAFFSSVQTASRYTGPPADALMRTFRFRADDLITPAGLMVTGNLVLAENKDILSPLFPGLASFFPGTVVRATTQAAVRARVQALNTEINKAAKAAGAIVYDLNGFFARIRARGLQAGSKTLTADYLGGFYSLNGYYPGVTAHAAIANEMLQLLNTTYRTSFPLLDLARVSTDDPAVRFTPAAKKPAAEELQ
jgi:hypothetical protein